MVDVDKFFSIILFTLTSILLIVLIILGIKLIRTLKKVDSVVDDIDDKSKKLDGLFNIVDGATDALASVSDKFVGVFTNALTGLFTKKRKKKENKDE